MKKIYLTLGLGALFLGANAQQNLKTKNSLTKGGIHKTTTVNSKGAKSKFSTVENSTKNNQRNNQPNSTMTAIWSDDFSSATTWTFTHAAGTTSDWKIGTTGGVGTYSIGLINSTTAANGFATFDSDYLCDTTDGQIANMTNVTAINLTGHPSVKLVFEQFYRRDADSTRIYVSNNGTTWTNFPINEEYAANAESPNPETVNVNISSVAGNQATVWIRFTYYSPKTASSWVPNVGPDKGCGYNWLVDDASIQDLPANDLTAIAAYSGSECGATLGGVELVFKNSGAAAASNIPVKYKVNGGAAVVETYTGTVAPGDTGTYIFTTPITVAAGSSYNITAYADLAGDGNVADDTAKTAFAGTPYAIPYSTSFESAPVTDLSGWAPYDASGLGSTWAVDTQIPNSGNQDLLVYEQAGVADEWLFSPCLSLVTGGIYQVTYAVQTPSLTAPAVSAGSLGIFLGDSAAVSHMTMTVQPSTAYAPSTTYTTAIATFTATATGNFILGFEATNSNASDQLVMALDDINITKIGQVAGIKTIANSADLSVYPNPTNGLLNITTTAATATVEVYNVMGQNIMSKTLVNGLNTIDIGNLSNGVYSIQIMQNNTLTVGKIIKTN
jgi:hypothetical protein